MRYLVNYSLEESHITTNEDGSSHFQVMTKILESHGYRQGYGEKYYSSISDSKYNNYGKIIGEFIFRPNGELLGKKDVYYVIQ